MPRRPKIQVRGAQVVFMLVSLGCGLEAPSLLKPRPQISDTQDTLIIRTEIL